MSMHRKFLIVTTLSLISGEQHSIDNFRMRHWIPQKGFDGVIIPMYASDMCVNMFSISNETHLDYVQTEVRICIPNEKTKSCIIRIYMYILESQQLAV